MSNSWLKPDLPFKFLSKRFLIPVLLLILMILASPWSVFTVTDGRVTSLDPAERVQPITAPVNGFVNKWYVIEGQKVKQGDPIAELSDNDESLVERLQKELEAAQSGVDSAKLMMDTGLINLERQKKLFEQGLSARKDYENAKIDYSKLSMEHAKSLATLTKAQTQLSRQQMQKVLAPRDGVITRIVPTIKGQILSTGSPLAVLVPNLSKKAIEVWVEGNDAPLILPGQKARVQFEGWPAIQVPGWPSLAIGTFEARVHIQDLASSQKGKFRVLLIPEGNWPSETFVRLGAKVRAYIHLTPSFVAKEIWRQLNSFPIPNEALQDELNDLLFVKGDKSDLGKDEK
jgi:multidrug efflux pump subunit AcrA (membrane-fusion protein)